MNTRNKEDIPTRNFKKKKKQQKHSKLKTDDFPHGTETNKKKQRKKKKKKKKRKTTTKKTKKKIPAKHREKFSNGPAELKYKMDGEFLSAKTLSTHLFTSQLAK